MTQKDIQLCDGTIRVLHGSGMQLSLPSLIRLVKALSDIGVDIIELVDGVFDAAICQSFPQQAFLVSISIYSSSVERILASGAQHIGLKFDLDGHVDANTKHPFIHQEALLRTTAAVQKANRIAHWVIQYDDHTSTKILCKIASMAQSKNIPVLCLSISSKSIHPSDIADRIHDIKTHYHGAIRIRANNAIGLANAIAVAAIDTQAHIIDVCGVLSRHQNPTCDLYDMVKLLTAIYHHTKYVLNKLGPLHQVITTIDDTTTTVHPIQASNPEFYQTMDIYGEHRLPSRLIVGEPFIKCATELPLHLAGVGTRWVLADNRIDPRQSVYVMERHFDKDFQDITYAHVGIHSNTVNANCIFMGTNPDGTGLTVRIIFIHENEKTETRVVSSPASIFIPAFTRHTYEYISGTGRYLHIVLSGNYMDSFLGDCGSSQKK